MNLSQHFTLEEATHSGLAIRLGITNQPSEACIERMRDAAGQMEAVRTLLGGVKIWVTSWYRCLALNRALRSADTSAHIQGWAIDFVAPPFGTPLQVCRAILDAHILMDQLIYEGSWVHISFNPRGWQQALTAHFSPTGVTYTQGI